MCMSNPKQPVDNSAQLAREAEAARQARITQGTGSIDNAFNSYNDDFYNQYQNDYSSYYQPQLEDQYSDARERLTLNLAKTGNLTSSTGADQFGDLKTKYNDRNTGITNEALDAANALRGNVDSRKSMLYADNRSAADPGFTEEAAAKAASSLQPTAFNSPLADTFSDFFNNIGNAAGVGTGKYQNTGVQTFGGGSNNSVKYYGK